MFKKIEVTRHMAKSKTKELKKHGHISSREISEKIRKGEIVINITNNCFFTKLKKIVTKNDNYHAVYLKICEPESSWSVDGRWWYMKKELPDLVRMALNT